MDKDFETLSNIKKFRKKRSRSFAQVISSKDITSDDMDELFLDD